MLMDFVMFGLGKVLEIFVFGYGKPLKSLCLSNEKNTGMFMFSVHGKAVDMFKFGHRKVVQGIGMFDNGNDLLC